MVALIYIYVPISAGHLTDTHQKRLWIVCRNTPKGLSLGPGHAGLGRDIRVVPQYTFNQESL